MLIRTCLFDITTGCKVYIDVFYSMKMVTFTYMDLFNVCNCLYAKGGMLLLTFELSLLCDIPECVFLFYYFLLFIKARISNI